MANGINREVKQFINTVAEHYPMLLKIYLFGSFASGNQNPDSDIDIAIVFDKIKNEKRFDLQLELMLLASKFDTRIEPHPLTIEDFNSGTNPFAFEIQKTGIELFTSTESIK